MLAGDTPTQGAPPMSVLRAIPSQLMVALHLRTTGPSLHVFLLDTWHATRPRTISDGRAR